MDGDGVGRLQVAHLKALEGGGATIEVHRYGPGHGIDGGDCPEVAVEDVLVVVVAGLDYLVSLAEQSLSENVSGALRVEGIAKLVVQVGDAGDSPMERGEDLDVLEWIESELFWEDFTAEASDGVDAGFGLEGPDEVNVSGEVEQFGVVSGGGGGG